MKDNKKNKTNTKKGGGALVLALIFVIAFAAGIFIGEIFSRIEGFYELGPVRYLIEIIGIIAVHYISIVAHEAGHLVFGLLSGYRFSSFRIFSFMWVKDGDRIRFCRFSLVGTGGQCLMEPPEPDGDGRIPVFLYNMGGVFVNLILFALCLTLYLVTASTAPVVAAISAIGAIYNLVAGALINGIPIKTASINNDGHNALSLGKNPAAMRAFRLQMLMNAELTRGKRIKDMPEDWFELPSDEEMQNSMTASIAVFACNRLMDECRFAEADALMERVLGMENAIVGIHRNLLVCDRIFCELIDEGREDVIDGLLDKNQSNFMKSMKKFPSVIRTEYALALLSDKDEERAAEIRATFEKIGKSYPYKQDVISEMALLDKALEVYEAKRAGHNEIR